MYSSPIIVIDNGSYNLKAGLSGHFEPNYTFKSQVARHNVIGHGQRLSAGHYISKTPKSAVITNVFDDEENWDWNGVEKLYNHVLCDKFKFKVEDEECKFLIAEKPFTKNKTKSKLSQMLFESFNCNGLYFAYTTSLSLYAAGLSTGCVIDSGYKSTYITPIFEGCLRENFSKKLNFGGLTLDLFLKDLLHSKSKSVPVSLREAEIIKTRYSFVAPSVLDAFEQAQKTGNKQSCMLPDGKKMKCIDIEAENFEAVELMFQPDLYDPTKGEEPIPLAVRESICRCSPSFQKHLYKSIILSGGNTMIKGFKQRLSADIRTVAPAIHSVKVHAPPQRRYSAWTGGSLLAEQDQMNDVWITRELYNEIGSDSFIIRCF